MRAPALFLLLACACTAPERDPSDAADAGASDAADPGPQGRYTYEDCAITNDLGCPRTGTYFCAFQKIRAKYDACASDPDCAVIDWEDCIGTLDCGGVPVARASEAAFRAEVVVERDRYCTNATCRGGASCAGRFDVPVCQDGHCAATGTDAGTRPDAGHPTDGGSSCEVLETNGGWHAAPAPKDLPLGDVSVPVEVTYWEVRRGSEFLTSAGTLCAGAADREACETSFLTRASEASGARCAPPGCPIVIAWQEPTRDAVGLAGADARAFLGDVTSETEAVLVAQIAGYSTDGDTANSGARTSTGGFEVVGSMMTMDCDPIRFERQRVFVPRSGEPDVLCSEITSNTPGVCI